MIAAVAAPQIKDGTLRMLAWARLWSPLSDEATLRATWDALGLAGDFDDPKARRSLELLVERSRCRAALARWKRLSRS